MYCQSCGTANAETASACSSCGAPFAQHRAPAPSAAVASTVKDVSRDALAAFKSLAGDPVGALPRACEALGEAKALRSGIAFGIVSLVCFLVAGPMLTSMRMSQFYDGLRFGGFLKVLLFAAIPFLCIAVGSMGVRKALGGQGSTGSDCFLAGAALLPTSLCMLASGMLGVGNLEVIGVLSIFAACLAILMLFTGYTRITKLSDRAASLAVPLVVLLTAWMGKAMLTSVMSSFIGPSGMGPGGFGAYGGFGGY